MVKNNVAALILGSHVNAYSIVKELHFHAVKNIIIFQKRSGLASFSNKLLETQTVPNNSSALLDAIKCLQNVYDEVVVFPTDDDYLEALLDIEKEISSFCFLPFNKEKLALQLDKFYQYEICEKIGVPYPRSINIKVNEDLDLLNNMKLPILVKPSKRMDLTQKVFRAKYIEKESDLLDFKVRLNEYFLMGVEFIASEFIPGDDTNIYALTCYRAKNGKILGYWKGKKLTQFPNEFGVVSSASSSCPQVVQEQGLKLVDGLDAFGVIEPEFKFDSRDGLYKLMEVNLRSMMWHHVGFLSGVSLHYIMYLDALRCDNKATIAASPNKDIHWVLMLHEIPNLIARSGYLKHFKSTVWGGTDRCWAIFDKRDLKPFIYSLALLFKMSIVACLNRLKKK
ncbi:hypothetical protein [Pseudoalteromonas prydzensis]|uniref:hypothetical protein n=1 Tax=Pseudoalteromonas prydzensis TaxID=182141 RepID=UPI0007E4FE1F|nr:hypothetical protein [Pseudoalteromonas prydzensis]MBE0376694.1 hypothetical protein [Pseudoalteromonas prydzensis ACAM 620]